MATHGALQIGGTGGVEGEMAEHSHTTETDAKPEKAAKGCQLGTVPQKKCELCDVAYITEHELQEHQWSMMHHINLEKANAANKKYNHKCGLCKVGTNGLNAYSDHINGRRHYAASQKRNRKIEKRNRMLRLNSGIEGDSSDGQMFLRSHPSTEDVNVKPGRVTPKKKTKPKFPKKKQTGKKQWGSRSSSSREQSPCSASRSRDISPNDRQMAIVSSRGHHMSLPNQQRSIYTNPPYTSFEGGGFVARHQWTQGISQVGKREFQEHYSESHSWPGGSGCQGGYNDDRGSRHLHNRLNNLQNAQGNRPGEASGQRFYFDRQPGYSCHARQWNYGSNNPPDALDVNFSRNYNSSSHSHSNLEFPANSERPLSQSKGDAMLLGDNETSAGSSKSPPKGKNSEPSLRTDTLKLSEKASQIIDSILARTTTGNTSSHVAAISTAGGSSSITTTTKSGSSTLVTATTRPSQPPSRYLGGATSSLSKPTSLLKTTQCHNPTSRDRSIKPDHGANLLQRAERLCAELREKRLKARQKQEQARSKAEETDRIDNEINYIAHQAITDLAGVLNSDKRVTTASRFQGDAGKQKDQGKRSGASIRQVPRPHIPAPRPRRDTSSSIEEFPSTSDDGQVVLGTRSAVRPVGRKQGAAVQGIPVARLRPSKVNEGMDKDNLMKLVNSPRSRKERMQVAKMMQTHQRIMQRQAARPKLNLQSAEEGEQQSDTDLDLLPSASTLQLDDLSEDIRMQIAALMNEEMEANEVIDLDTEESDQGGNLTFDEILAEDEALAELVGVEPVSQVADSSALVDLTQSDSFVEVSHDDILMDLRTNPSDDVEPRTLVQETQFITSESYKTSPNQRASNLMEVTPSNCDKSYDTAERKPDTNLAASCSDSHDVLDASDNPVRIGVSSKDVPPPSYPKVTGSNDSATNRDTLPTGQLQSPARSTATAVLQRQSLESEVKTNVEVNRSFDCEEPMRSSPHPPFIVIKPELGTVKMEDSNGQVPSSVPGPGQRVPDPVPRLDLVDVVVKDEMHVIHVDTDDEDDHDCDSLSSSQPRPEMGIKRRCPSNSPPSQSPDHVRKETEEAKRRRIEADKDVLECRPSVIESSEFNMILDSSAGHRDPRTSTEGTVVVSEVQGSCSEGAAVDVVLALSLEEEEIRQRVQEADAAIEKLHLLIQSTQEQLQRRKVAREKLLQEEEALRSRRLQILKGAVAERKSVTPTPLHTKSMGHQFQTLELAFVSPLEGSQQSSTSEWDSSSALQPLMTVTKETMQANQDEADSTCESVGEMIRRKAVSYSNSEPNKDLVKVIEIKPQTQESGDPDFLEADTTVGVDVGGSEAEHIGVMEKGLTEGSDSLSTVLQEEFQTVRTKSNSFSTGDADSQCSDIGPDFTLHYMGSLKTDCMDPAILQRIAEMYFQENGGLNKQAGSSTVYEAVGAPEKTMSEVISLSGSETDSADDPEIQDESFTKDDANSTTEVGRDDATTSMSEDARLGEANRKTKESFSADTGPAVLATPKKSMSACFVRLQRIPKPGEEILEDSLSSITPQSPDPTQEPLHPPQCSKVLKSRVTKSKVKPSSKFYPDPEAGVKMKLKSKRLRDLTRPHVNANSGSSTESKISTETDSDSDSTAPPRGLRKRAHGGVCSNLMRQYLHAESSSDVDLTDSVERKTCQNSVENLDSVEGTAVHEESLAIPTGAKTSSADRKIFTSSQAKSETRSGRSHLLSTMSVHSEQGVSSEPFSTTSRPSTVPEIQYKEHSKIRSGTMASSDHQSGPRPSASPADLTPKQFKGHNGAIHAMCIWGDFLFTGSEDHTACRFDLQTTNVLNVYEGHIKGIQCLVVVTPSGNEDPRVFTGSFDNSVHGYNMNSGKVEVKHKFAHRVHCFHECWGKLYVGLGNGNIKCLDIRTNTFTETFECSKAAIRFIESAREGTRNLLCVASNDCSISIRDAHSSLLLRMLEGHTKAPMHIQVYQHLLYSGAADKTVQVHNLNTGEHEKTLNHKGVVTSLCVDGNVLLSAGYEGLVRCFDLRTFELRQLYYGAGQGMIMNMILYNNTIYTGNRDGLVEAQRMDRSSRWNCQFGRCTMVFGLRGHLEYHVLHDHLLPNQAIVRCLWQDCTQSMSTQDNSKEAMEHLAQHLTDDFK